MQNVSILNSVTLRQVSSSRLTLLINRLLPRLHLLTIHSVT